MLTEYNELDARLLIAARIERLQELVPDLVGLDITTDEDTLLIDVASPSEAMCLITRAKDIIASAGLVFGTASLEVSVNCSPVFFIEVQSVNSLKDAGKNMVATAERIDLSVEVPLTSQTETTIISWKAVAGRLGETEQQLKKRASALKIPFYWSEDGSWGLAAKEASTLIMQSFIAKGQQEVQAMLGEATLQAALQNPSTEQKSKSKASTIKFQQEFKPVKSISTTIERYLEALHPSDTDAQNQVIHEVVSQTTLGKRHVKNFFSGYTEKMAKPLESEVIAGFVRLKDRRVKCAGTPPEETTPITSSEPDAEDETEEE
jgi:hypothetical protein